MFPRKGEQQQALTAQYNGYKFMWPANTPFVITQGWHYLSTWSGQFSAYSGIDFDVSGAANSDILASAPGTVTYVCNDGTQVLLTITTSGTSEKMGYLHLDTASVNAAGIGQGSVVNFGTKLGRMLNSDGGTISTTCGVSMGTHLHMYLPYRGVTIDGSSSTPAACPRARTSTPPRARRRLPPRSSSTTPAATSTSTARRSTGTRATWATAR